MNDDPDGLIAEFFLANGLITDHNNDHSIDLYKVLADELFPDYVYAMDDSVSKHVKIALTSILYPEKNLTLQTLQPDIPDLVLTRLLRFRFRLLTKCVFPKTLSIATKVREVGSTCRWPLGICPNMDRVAIENGLDHWSCLDAFGNDLWMRRDGQRCVPTFSGEHGFIDDLRNFDQSHPITRLKF